MILSSEHYKFIGSGMWCESSICSSWWWFRQELFSSFSTLGFITFNFSYNFCYVLLKDKFLNNVKMSMIRICETFSNYSFTNNTIPSYLLEKSCQKTSTQTYYLQKMVDSHKRLTRQASNICLRMPRTIYRTKEYSIWRGLPVPISKSLPLWSWVL